MSMVSGGRQREGTRGVSPEDDDDEVGTLDVALVSRTNEEKEKEKYYRALLVGALDPDQYARYERWRSSKLADAVVRRVSFGVFASLHLSRFAEFCPICSL